ncbi:MAG: hypothetical protein HY278_01245 [candidate division NC10 bacterium]|nr:hypothetical protein [candidate division NC10 bacterium]
MESLYELSRTRGIPFTDALDLVRGNSTLVSGRGMAAVTDIGAVERLLDEIRVAPSDDMFSFLRDLARQQIADENLRNQIVSLFERVSPAVEVTDLEQLLRAINVSLGNAEQDRESDRVAIMTMHQAKGLSADAVIVVGVEDEYIPGRAQGEAVGHWDASN